MQSLIQKDLLFTLTDGRELLIPAPTVAQWKEACALDPQPGERRTNREKLNQLYGQVKILIRHARFVSTPADASPVPLGDLADDLTLREAVEIIQACAAHFHGLDVNGAMRLQRFLAAQNSMAPQ